LDDRKNIECLAFELTHDNNPIPPHSAYKEQVHHDMVVAEPDMRVEMPLPQDRTKSHINSIEFLYVPGNKSGISDEHNVPGFKLAAMVFKDYHCKIITRILTESAAIGENIKSEKLRLGKMEHIVALNMKTHGLFAKRIHFMTFDRDRITSTMYDPIHDFV
jgi:hypothetical protein